MRNIIICLLLSVFSVFSTASEGDVSKIPPLHEASRSGLVEKVKELIAQGDNVKAQDQFGMTPLHWAGNAAVARVLIKAGADLEARDNQGDTPLHRASWVGLVETVEELLAHGANIKAQGGANLTPLHKASRRGHTKTVKVLIAKKGVEVDAQSVGGLTPLHEASKEGKTDTIKVLIHAGANVNARDKTRYTPLFYALNFFNINVKTARVLVAAGADLGALRRPPLYEAWRNSIERERVVIELKQLLQPLLVSLAVKHI